MRRQSSGKRLKTPKKKQGPGSQVAPHNPAAAQVSVSTEETFTAELSQAAAGFDEPGRHQEHQAGEHGGGGATLQLGGGRKATFTPQGDIHTKATIARQGTAKKDAQA